MKNLRLLLLLTSTSLLGPEAFAQDLVLNLLSGETESYPTEDIRSIKFPGNDMVITQDDGTVISMDIAAVASYEFDMSTVSSDDREGAYGQALKIYPNPASDRVQITYTGRESAALIVDIVDGTGRTVESLYRGGHATETLLVWHPGALAKGTYLCRVTAGDRVVTGKIIVQ